MNLTQAEADALLSLAKRRIDATEHDYPAFGERAAPTVASLFHEDVVAWLDQADIRYTPNVKITGKTGYDHRFDFVIPKSRHQPERVLRTINRPSRDNAQATVFSWIDTREVRSPESRAYAILNDVEQPILPTVLSAFRNYDVQPVPWSKRDAARKELAA